MYVCPETRVSGKALTVHCHGHDGRHRRSREAGVGFAPFRTADGELTFAQHEIIGVVADSQFDSLRTAPRSEMFKLSGNANMLLFLPC